MKQTPLRPINETDCTDAMLPDLLKQAAAQQRCFTIRLIPEALPYTVQTAL